MGVIETCENRLGVKETIIMVEDDISLSRLIKKKLESYGLQVESAKSGSDAISKIKKDQNVLLLLDYGLPDMLGDQVVEKLIEKGNPVPFIVMTGQGDEQIAVKMMKLGAREYVIKDGNFIDLLPQVVLKVIEQMNMERQLAETEEKLREKERSISTLMKHLPGIAYRCKNDTDRTMIFVSEGCKELTNHHPDSMNKNAYIRVIHPNDRDMVLKKIQSALEEKRLFEIVYRINTADGDERWVWEKGSGVFSLEGELLALEGFISDITDLKQAEEELKKSKEQLQDFFDNASDLIQSMAPDGTLLYANRTWREKLGYTKEELDNISMFDIIHPDSLRHCMKTFQSIMRGEKVDRIEAKFVAKDGRTIIVEGNINCRFVNGKAVATRGLFRDITERKIAEEELAQKTEELILLGNDIHDLNMHLDQKVEERTTEIEKLIKHKDEFISQLGHDIKTPLTPLTSLLPVIEKKENDPKSKELLEICIRNVGYITNLVISTLQLARISSKDAVFDFKEVNLLNLIDTVICDNRTIIEDYGIKTEKKIDEKIVVLADKIRLREVFINLITNALKFTKRGGTLTIEAKLNDDGFTTISFKDTGIGLDEEEKIHLFEEFYKADQSRHELDSSGLGLPICKRIVEKHGGKIWVESKGKGKGSTFYFTIPIKKTEKSEILTV